MSVWDAFWLGLIQGLAEFLPISSDGHLALAQLLFGIREGGLTLTVMLHVGTLLATALVLRERLGRAVLAGLSALRAPSLFVTDPGGRDALFVVVASVPTAVIGFALRDRVEAWTLDPNVIAAGFAATAVCLLLSTAAQPGEREDPSWGQALLVGAMQGLAVLPGVSRSCLTITTLLFAGIARPRAFELSMLMSIPAVLGAVILETPHALRDLSQPGLAAFGTFVAFVTGVAALLALRRIVVSGKFSWFAAWVGPLALATFALARAWPR
ncbi:MAG TPA: undecaprenyl-diphosphate phosphatase [Polyangiaceae bacterium]|nr:undecaprenyl-diphosphate phosphatase [Polyangiaceae bacterium]